MELPSDEFLLALVRIQLLSQKLSIKVVSIQSCASTSEEDIRTMVKQFEQEIDVYRASLTQNLRDNGKKFCMAHGEGPLINAI